MLLEFSRAEFFIFFSGRFFFSRVDFYNFFLGHNFFSRAVSKIFFSATLKNSRAKYWKFSRAKIFFFSSKKKPWRSLTSYEHTTIQGAITYQLIGSRNDKKSLHSLTVSATMHIIFSIRNMGSKRFEGRRKEKKYRSYMPELFVVWRFR